MTTTLGKKCLATLAPALGYALAACAVSALALAACVGNGGGSSELSTPNAAGLESRDQARPAGSGVSGQLVVFAASSLVEAFEDIKTALRTWYPGLKVTYNFAGTPTLRMQLEQGAPADLFVSASEPQMEHATRSGVVQGAPQVFATNRLVVIAPSQGGVTSLADLARPGVRLVLGLKEVPVGAYARQSIALMGASGRLGADFEGEALANVVSEEVNVHQVVAKVVLGEADAGIVYVTDVTAEKAGKIRVIPIPDEFNVVARYLIARVTDSANPNSTEAFIAFLLSPDGQAILARYGFGGVP